jgi:L-lactate dehydrogenase (cytochrome)
VKFSDVRQLVQVRMPVLSPRRRVLASAFNVAEYRRAAKRALPAGIFDYMEGGAEDEATLQRNQRVFDRWGFAPAWGATALPGTAAPILGRMSDLPLTLTPTGATRLFHPEGELAVARAASRANVPYALAGLSTVSMEAVARQSPDLDRWFNVGLNPDRGALQSKLDRCAAEGYRAIVVGLDTRALGSRERDSRNGFTAPRR